MLFIKEVLTPTNKHVKTLVSFISLKPINSSCATIGIMILLKDNAYFLTTIKNLFTVHGLITYHKDLMFSGSMMYL